ncbi:MAG: ABC transporter ATP-binding protein [Rhodoglobus sp.]
MTVLARLDRVSRHYGALTAVDDVSLEIRAGEMLGLLGPNGAGKTTVISLLQGLRRPSSGTVELFGGDPRDAVTRQHLGSTPQESALPAALTAREVIDFVGGHFAERLTSAELAAEFGLEDLLKRQTGALSGGQKRRLSVALAFVGRPRLVLLDEPSTGLDVDARRALWDAVRRQHANGATVVVTSHYLEEVEALADRVVVLRAGRVIADDALGNVIARVGLSWVRFESGEAVSSLRGAVRHEVDGRRHSFAVRDSDAFVAELVRSGIHFEGLSVRGATLEEAFLNLTDEGGA